MHGVAPILPVTVLTSMDESDVEAVGQPTPLHEQVIRLAKLTKSAGLDGVVCSPKEAAAVRELCGDSFVRIVPGIRPSWSVSDDQKRFTTPKQALSDGASYLVIGRPITQADDPVEAAFRIAQSWRRMRLPRKFALNDPEAMRCDIGGRAMWAWSSIRKPGGEAG